MSHSRLDRLDARCGGPVVHAGVVAVAVALGSLLGCGSGATARTDVARVDAPLDGRGGDGDAPAGTNAVDGGNGDSGRADGLLDGASSDRDAPAGTDTPVGGADATDASADGDLHADAPIQVDGFVPTDGGTTPVVQQFGLRAADLDILFMVDNSIGMGLQQQALMRDFPAFIQVLQAAPGGMPNLHLGVVSSDMGAGIYDVIAIPFCRHGGDQGILQNTPRGTCVTSGLAAGASFISNVGGVANYDTTKSIADVFTCIALLGESGCALEHQLASVARALGAGGQPAPQENAGFLRPTATLAVVLFTNEDDCSAPPDSTLFDPMSKNVTDPLGPLTTSYRCNEYGHLCGGQHPPRTTSADLSGTCHSAEDGVLLRIGEIAGGLKALKTDSAMVHVAAITGPPNPYVVNQVVPLDPTSPDLSWPKIHHSCQAIDNSTFADPAVRISDFLTTFGPNASSATICADSFVPALTAIATDLVTVSSHCLSGVPPDGDPSAPGIQPLCTAHLTGVPDAGATGTPVAACPAPAGTPCFVITAEPACAASGFAATLRANGATLALGASVSIRCDVPPVVDAGGAGDSGDSGPADAGPADGRDSG